MSSLTTANGLSARQDADLDEVVDRFEEAWQTGRRPALEEYLLADGALRLPLLTALVHVDLERRLKAGEAARVEDYLARYPELGGADTVLDLLAAEYRQRRRREPGLGDEEYARRFPHHREQLPRYLNAEPASATLTDNGGVTAAGVSMLRRPLVPGYEVLEELGRGGMGVVYRARQVKLNRLVALKMILAGGQAAEADRARFLLEAEAVARLQHPHIVGVYEVGEQDGLPFLALEYCAGGSLEKKLAGTPLPPQEAARLIETLARAMHAAHRADVVHRDLKPANVLLTEEGEPKVTDFGLAKCLDVQGRTQTGAILGTPSYMAPEQAEGRARDVGPATDVYALGAILYECLTGRPPFKAATSLDTVRQVIAEEALPPSRLNRAVPLDLETICLHCLHKEPERRYQSALELAGDLAHFRAGESILARPSGAVERTFRWVRRRPAVAALAAVTLLGTLALLVTVLLYNARLKTEYDLEVEARREAQEAKETAEQALLESQKRLALNYFAYGRLCAVAARLATASERGKVEDSLREFHKLERWLAVLGDEAVRPALADYSVLLQQWRDAGPPPEGLKRRSLALAKACRKPWTDLIDRECRELANQVRRLLYARVVEAADELLEVGPGANSLATQEFWELYWGELVMVEDRGVEQAMVRLGAVLQHWQSGPAPAELSGRVEDLRLACRLPAPGGRGPRGGRVMR
jgi:tRNA A-37 threonylcarbamoyl transferase component Bud32